MVSITPYGNLTVLLKLFLCCFDDLFNGSSLLDTVVLNFLTCAFFTVILCSFGFKLLNILFTSILYLLL